MVRCCVFGCVNKDTGRYCKTRFFRFPTQTERKNAWLRFANNSSSSSFTNARVCEFHFANNQYELQRNDGRKLLKWNAVPTILPNRIQHEINEDTEPDNGPKENAIVVELQEELEAANSKIRALEKEKENLVKTLQFVFNKDQITFLENKVLETKKAQLWDSSTIEKSLRIYLACGSSGYEVLRDQGFPLPSIRTLQLRIQHFKFNAA